MNDFPSAAYDAWKTTPPEGPTCPDCGCGALEDDGYGGFDCPECGWAKPGPDPDEAYDRMRDRELERDEPDWEV